MRRYRGIVRNVEHHDAEKQTVAKVSKAAASQKELRGRSSGSSFGKKAPAEEKKLRKEFAWSCFGLENK